MNTRSFSASLPSSSMSSRTLRAAREEKAMSILMRADYRQSAFEVKLTNSVSACFFGVLWDEKMMNFAFGRRFVLHVDELTFDHRAELHLDQSVIDVPRHLRRRSQFHAGTRMDISVNLAVYDDEWRANFSLDRSNVTDDQRRF